MPTTTDLHRLAGLLLLSQTARHTILSSEQQALLGEYSLTHEERISIEQADLRTLPEALALLENLVSGGQPALDNNTLSFSRHPAAYPSG